MSDEEDEECPLCMEEKMTVPVTSNCGHTMCGTCVLDAWNNPVYNMYAPIVCSFCRGQVLFFTTNFRDEHYNDPNYSYVVRNINAYNRIFRPDDKTILLYIMDWVTFLWNYVKYEGFGQERYGLHYTFKMRLWLNLILVLLIFKDNHPPEMVEMVNHFDIVLHIMQILIYSKLISYKLLIGEDERGLAG
ncbi:unnamed protein product [Notodromas monacha]|uniref:RING-type domain-containing protein n=1 Tax=Notodromas monacha TaxID=399045 RepID=A0A7R9GD25_9CRUS|nr:unnamed protein product [Notodromas monacha]CAG0916473.1 unnamed protein product [Notodromas monacha]